MRRIEITIGDKHVKKGYTTYNKQIPEDSNILFYKDEESLRADIVRRTRCVIGFRGGNMETPLNGNALQHVVRDIFGGFRGSINVDEYVVARHAVFVAGETQYWLGSGGMNDV